MATKKKTATKKTATKKPATKKAATKKTATKKTATKKTATKKTATKKTVAAKAPRNAYEEKRPDVSADTVVTWARKLARQARVDLAVLASARVNAADVTKLDALADALEAAQRAWTTVRDQRSVGSVAATRAPLRAGRDQLCLALRTFVDEGHPTHRTLDDIGDVTGDDDLAEDTTRLLALVKKHADDLKGTDVTAARIAEVKAALDAFNAARVGARSDDAAETLQAESEALRTVRRARNVAYWNLATFGRSVARRGQYALREDRVKRAKYTLYYTGSTASRDGTAGGEGDPT